MRLVSRTIPRVTEGSLADRPSPRIGLLAINAGGTNLGDEAVLAGALEALRTRIVGASVSVYSANAREAAERYGVDTVSVWDGRADPGPTRPPGVATPAATAIRRVPLVSPLLRIGVHSAKAVLKIAHQPRFILRAWRQLRGTSLLILAGSNQLEDAFGGAFGYPYAILIWTVLARLVGARVTFVSVGAGPLRSRLSAWMCLLALRLTTYASFRDAGSLEYMRSLGYRGHGVVVPDLAFALALDEPPSPPGANIRRIAVNVYPYGDPLYDPAVLDGGVRFAAYVDAIAEFVARARARDYEPVLFGCQHADERALGLVKDRLDESEPGLAPLEMHVPSTLSELTSVIDGCDAVIATRYHGIMFGILRGRPTVGICYHPKSRRLLEMAGLTDNALEAEGLSADALLEKVSSVLASGPSLPIRARALALREECLRGFDEALDQGLRGVVVPRVR